jgi:predicted dehydrogenase
MGGAGSVPPVSATPYRVLIIGCGNIAGGFDMTRPLEQHPLSHAGAYVRHGRFRLAACMDPDDARRIAFARHWGVETHVAELKALQVQPGYFDVISICSPTDLHHEHLVHAISQRPRVIFCEKPITSEPEAAARLVQDCQDLGISLAVNYSRRWDPFLADLIQQLQEGRWGRLRSVVGHYNKGILNNGGHMVDLLLRLVGPMRLVSAACAEYDFWESDPTVAALLTSDDGRIPVYLNPAHARDFAFFELELTCELGVIRMLSGGMAWQFREATPSPQFTGYRTLGDSKLIQGRYLETMGLAIQEIYTHLELGTPLSCAGVEALLTQKMCISIQRSALNAG